MMQKKQVFNLPGREQKILEFWERERIFEKSLQKTKRGKPFIFYEGPPTANAAPGIHHVESRAFKDIIPRYKTMRGFQVLRKAGWDTHGLPVELQVEKELGLKTKKDIEHYGIAEFNEKCRESVWRFKEEWERLTKRIGFWLDLEHPYITYETSYIETLWWIIKEIWKKGLLYKDFKIIPWCPRCQTGLSSHELGQPGAYIKVKEDSVFVRLKIKDRKNESLLVWTTTPWTLPANVAVAVNPTTEYTKFKIGNEFVWSANVPPYDAKGASPEITEKVSGKALVGLSYEPLYAPASDYGTVAPPYRVYGADFVSTEEGSGFVHLAPAYGEEDMAAMKKEYSGDYPILETVDPDGRMKKGVIGEGKFVKEADKVIVEDLKKRKLLFAILPYEHEYPHCWRCGTPLLYYARNSWWVRMTKIKQELIKNNQTIDWVPEHIKDGRFGEFLSELRDWAFSRERYWGTPLPIWECTKCKAVEALSSLEELAGRAKSSGNTYFALRHGESETQLLGIVADSNSKYHMTDLGKEQIRLAAEKLKKENIDIIIHSDVLRTTEAARIVAEVLGVKEVLKDTRVREINVGIFNGRPTKEYNGFYSSAEEYFAKAPPEGESLSDLRARLMGFMQDIDRKYRNKKILIISHEYPIWILDGASRGLDRDGIIKLRGRKEDYIGLAGVQPIKFLNLPRDNSGEVNLHRPFIDEVRLICKSGLSGGQACGGKMERVKDVADVWFDSGAMPFAQAHYPFAWAQNQKSKIKNQKEKLLYPADFIAEGVDQTRGWFYTLLAVATLLEKGAPFRHVISLGHVLDKNGQKMSKSKGNVVDPWEMMKKYGADTIRWYFFTANPPGEPKRFDEKDLLNKLRGPLATLWNSFVLFDTYVDKVPRKKIQRHRATTVLDRWLVGRLEYYSNLVGKLLDAYDVVGAARHLEGFLLDDFSNWYLRRSRRRFQKPASKADKDEAAAITGWALLRLAELVAPFTPFLAEIIYQELKPKFGLKENSVHLRPWPQVKAVEFEFYEMHEARALVALILAERAKHGIKVRQPLRTAKVKSVTLSKELLDVVRDEVNVKEIVRDETIAGEVELDTEITPELREEGWLREFVRNVQEMRKDLGLRPEHPIKLQAAGDAEMLKMLERSKKFVEKETGAKIFTLGGKKVFAVERELSIDGHELWVGIDRA